MDPFLGEIRVFGFAYAPRSWAVCNGQTLSIQQFAALYSLLGTQFGGDGRSTFGLPNLQAKVAIGMGQGPGLSSYYVGSTAGAATVTLAANQLAGHSHSLSASTVNATALTANGNVLARSTNAGRSGSGANALIYSANPANATTALDSRSIAPSGNGTPHNNMQPYVAMNYCIALQGIYPQRP